VRRDQRPQLELHVLVRREFIFEFCLTCPITPIGFADPGDALRRKFFFTFEANTGPFGKTEDVLGLYFVKSILRACGVGIAQGD
jgi:hypothetical protein